MLFMFLTDIQTNGRNSWIVLLQRIMWKSINKELKKSVNRELKVLKNDQSQKLINPVVLSPWEPLPKKYPSLKPNEVIQCLKTLGFIYTKSHGDHVYYEKGDRIVQVDMGEKQGFASPGMQIIINNS